MAKNNNGPSYADERKKALDLDKKKQALYKKMCREYMNANPTAKRCKLTDAQSSELRGMLNKGQQALVNKQKGVSTEAQKVKDDARIRAQYGQKYGRKKT